MITSEVIPPWGQKRNTANELEYVAGGITSDESIVHINSVKPNMPERDPQ